MTTTFFLNISNHPSSKWSEKQLSVARQYGEVTDWSFPSIDAEWRAEEVTTLVDQYMKRIFKEFPDPKQVTIHLMGELNFTFSLVAQLLAQGYVCVASTTQRVVVEKENHVKEVTFDFVAFRKYVLNGFGNK